MQKHDLICRFVWHIFAIMRIENEKVLQSLKQIETEKGSKAYDDWHDAVHYEQQLTRLQAITEDVTLFKHVTEAKYTNIVKGENTYSTTELQRLYCIEQYTRVVAKDAPNASFAMVNVNPYDGTHFEHDFLEEVNLRLEKIGFCKFIGEDWYVDVEDKGRFQKIGDVFSRSMKGGGDNGFTNRLCFNDKCFRREHVINQPDVLFHSTRHMCCGPKNGSCKCAAPLCLLPGPHWLPGICDPYTFYNNHRAIRFELDLHDLEMATQNPLLFLQAGLSPAVKQYADIAGLSTFEKNTMHCIEEYPRENMEEDERQWMDAENFLAREDPEIGENHEYIVAKRLYWLGFRWVRDVQARHYKWAYYNACQEKLVSVAEIFGDGRKDHHGYLRKLCYNDDCLRRDHQYRCSDFEYYKVRNNCLGPKKCKCPFPKCIILGPSKRGPDGRCQMTKEQKDEAWLKVCNRGDEITFGDSFYSANTK
jgi:hypothetical protein